MIGCLLLLAPSYWNCTAKYGASCLQSPGTFIANSSMQDGLRGARLMWSRPNSLPGTLPMVRDELMFEEYYRQCHITSAIGLDETSLMGCLLARPLTLPVFLAKKWIGLFDYFRFTPYLENQTPSWMRTLSRAYGALAWLGLVVFLLTLVKRHGGNSDSHLTRIRFTNLGITFLASYTIALLAQHTALHTEERYGFPLIPLSIAYFIGCWEYLINSFSEKNKKELVLFGVFCCLMLSIYIGQVISWDQLSFATNG